MAWCKRGPTLFLSHKKTPDYGQLAWQCWHFDASSRLRHEIMIKPFWLEVTLKSNTSWCFKKYIAPMFSQCWLVQQTFELSLDYEKNKSTNFIEHLQFPPQCPIFKKNCTTKFVQWFMQCTLIMKGTIWSLSWTITPILTPWKTLTPLAPNVINLDVIFSYVKSPYKTKTSTKMCFKLFKMTPSTTCYNNNNKLIFCQPSTTYACMETHNCWSQVVTSQKSSQEKEMNWTLCTKFCVFFTTTSWI